MPAIATANFIGDGGSGQGELDRGCVDDAHHVSTSRSLDDGEEWAIQTVFGVQLKDLLVVVRSLQQLNAGVERAAVSLQKNGHAVNSGVEGVRSEGPTLDGLVLGISDNIKASVAGFLIRSHTSGQRKLEVSGVADGNGVGASGGVNEGAERARCTVFDVHLHLVRSVVGTLPKFDIRIQRASICLQQDMYALNCRVGE